MLPLIQFNFMPKLHIILDILKERNIPITDFCKEINISLAGFKRIINRNSTKLQTLESIAEALQCPIGIFFNEPKPMQKKQNSLLIPHIPLSAQAGSLGGFTEGITNSGCEMNNHIPTLGSYDFTIDVRGESMLPDYHSGDIVACKKMYPDDFIRYGSVYILDTPQGIVMKKVEKNSSDSSSLTCISLNDNYKPFILPLEEIYSMSLVVGVIKSI